MVARAGQKDAPAHQHPDSSQQPRTLYGHRQARGATRQPFGLLVSPYRPCAQAGVLRQRFRSGGNCLPLPLRQLIFFTSPSQGVINHGVPEYPTGGAGFSASDQKGNLIAPRGTDLHPLIKIRIWNLPLAIRGSVSNATLCAVAGLGMGCGVYALMGNTPKIEAAALRAVFAILSKRFTPEQKRIAATKTEAQINGQTRVTAYHFEQLGDLLYPSNPQEAKRFTSKITAAQDDGNFVTRIPRKERGAFLTDLLGWQDFEGVPDDSPLKFWLDIPYCPKDARKKPRDWGREFQAAATPDKRQQITREAVAFFGTQTAAGQALGVSRQRVGSLLQALSEKDPKRSSSSGPWDIPKRKR